MVWDQGVWKSVSSTPCTSFGRRVPSLCSAGQWHLAAGQRERRAFSPAALRGNSTPKDAYLAPLLLAFHCSIKTELVRQANTHLVLGGFMAATVLKAECFCFIVFQNYFIILLWFYMLWAALGKTLLAVKDDLSGPSNSVSWRHRFNPHRVMHKICFDIPTSG